MRAITEVKFFLIPITVKHRGIPRKTYVVRDGKNQELGIIHHNTDNNDASYTSTCFDVKLAPEVVRNISAFLDAIYYGNYELIEELIQK